MIKFLFAATHDTERERLFKEFCSEFHDKWDFGNYIQDRLVSRGDYGLVLYFLYLNTPTLGLVNPYEKIDYITLLLDKNLPLSFRERMYLEKIDMLIKNGAKLITAEQAKEIIKEMLKDGMNDN